MKILVLSDLHLEYAAFTPDADAVCACDVVVLAGDIHPGVDGILWARQAFPDKPVVYVAGNHEFYGGDWERTLDKLRYTANVNNVHFLENDAISIQGVRFLGCSLWTDFDYFGHVEAHEAMYKAERFSDYRCIAKFFPECPITPRDTLERHQKSRAWLEAQAQKGDPSHTVVVTHHYPHKNSTAPRWQQDDLTPAFGSQLPEELLLRASGLWIHGHAHDSFDYRIDGPHVNGVQRYTRVVCNPRGFPMGVDRLRMENSRFRSGLLITQMPDGNWGECV